MQPSVTARELVMLMKACVVNDVAEGSVRLLFRTSGHYPACREISN